MTAILSLARRDDFISDVDALSLLDFSTGIALQDDGWQQAIADAGDQTVVEAMTLLIRGTSHDDLAAKVRLLDAKITQVYWYKDPQELYGVWLRARMPGETNARQALVVGAKRSPAPLWAGEIKNPSGGLYYLEQYQLALERMPFWESTAVVDYTQAGVGTVSSLGGKWDYTTYGGSPGAVAGDQPARMAQGLVTGVAGVGPMTRAWVGFRTNRFGNRANFVPVWNMHFSVDGLRSDADTTKVVDVNAADTNRTTTTFATVATMLRRNTLRVSDFIPATPNDARGTFMVLLRAKLSAGASSVNVRLVDGYISSQSMAARARVNITSTSYYLYEMGVVQIPSPGRPVAGYDIANYALGLDAERINGAASLHCDCFILIPMGEGYFTTDQPDAQAADGIGSAAGGFGHLVFERPDGVVQGVYLALLPSGNISVRYSGGLPAGSGLAVVAAQQLTASVKADTVSLEFQVCPRWTTLRGAA